jgi:hypothetical protein
MNIINVLICTIGLQYISFATTSAGITPQDGKEKASVNFYISSPNETLRAKYALSSDAKDVVITSVPVPCAGKILTSVNIELNMVGCFTFKRDAGLIIPANHEVFIEDKLSGKVFNLKTLATHSFRVDTYTPGRFMLLILDKSQSGTLASNP